MKMFTGKELFDAFTGIDKALNEMDQIMGGEKRIQDGFEKWFAAHDPNRVAPDDKHIEMCAFHAGARFAQGKLFDEK